MSVGEIGLELPNIFTAQDHDFRNFLTDAATGNLAGLQDFLERRPDDLNKIDDYYGASATHFAARHHQLGALEFLIEQSAILGRDTKKGFNELHYGIENIEITRLILEKAPNIINSTGQSGKHNILDFSEEHKNQEVFDYLHEYIRAPLSAFKMLGIEKLSKDKLAKFPS